MTKFYYSTLNVGNSVTPMITYKNIEDQKSSILTDNKGKGGIYRWTNIINNKSYIGSANDLRTRFYVYFSDNRLVSSKMTIYKAIIKYGYKNFRLDILEYCNSAERCCFTKLRRTILYWSFETWI